MNGIIKFYNNLKGYGSIIGEDNIDYYFHISGVKSENDSNIKNGLKVEYIPLKTK